MAAAWAVAVLAPVASAAEHDGATRLEFSTPVPCTLACPHKTLQPVDEIPALEPWSRLHGELACAREPLAPPGSYDEADVGRLDGGGEGVVVIFPRPWERLDLYVCTPEGGFLAWGPMNPVGSYSATFRVADQGSVVIRVFHTHLSFASTGWLRWCHEAGC